jgi:hypothetical protein
MGNIQLPLYAYGKFTASIFLEGNHGTKFFINVPSEKPVNRNNQSRSTSTESFGRIAKLLTPNRHIPATTFPIGNLESNFSNIYPYPPQLNVRLSGFVTPCASEPQTQTTINSCVTHASALLVRLQQQPRQIVQICGLWLSGCYLRRQAHGLQQRQSYDKGVPVGRPHTSLRVINREYRISAPRISSTSRESVRALLSQPPGSWLPFQFFFRFVRADTSVMPKP